MKTTCGAFLLTVGMAFSGFVHASDTTDPMAWTTTDYVLEGLTVTTLVIDRNQTTDISHHPDDAEVNPILGLHPDNSKINKYFATVIIGQAIIADLLPSEYRKGFLGVIVTGETMTIRRNNIHFGLSWKL